MSTINDLPAEIIATIFSYCPWIEDLVAFSHVCQKWRGLAQQRLKWVRHLIPEVKHKSIGLPSNSTTIYYNSRKTDNATFLKLIKMIKNIETVMISPEPSPVDIGDLLPKIVIIRPSLKRLSIPHMPRKRRVLPFIRLEGLALPCFFRWFSGVVTWCRDNARHIKQLHLKSMYGRQYELLFPNFANLKRLHIEECGGIGNFLDKFPNLDRMITLEMEIPAECYIDNILTKFANLKNLWLYIRKEKRFADRFPVYPSMENLVMEFETIIKVDSDIDYRLHSIISSIDMVFPNLKTLAVRNHRYLTAHELFSLPANLPYLEVLDIVGCWNIDENCVNTAYEVWRAAGRSIKIYHGSWHKSSTSIVGTGFMDDWFFRDFKTLPYFMEVLD